MGPIRLYNQGVTTNHGMITSSNGNLFMRYWPFVRGIHRSPVNSPHKGQWRGALMFSLNWTWTNDWVNNLEAGDLRRHRAHFDVIVMMTDMPQHGFVQQRQDLQYIPRNMHTVFALLCFVVVLHWLIFPYPPGLLHWHCGNLTKAPVPAKQPWWIWINTSCEFIMNDCITTTKQSTTKPCAYFLGYTVLCNPYNMHTILLWFVFVVIALFINSQCLMSFINLYSRLGNCCAISVQQDQLNQK